MRHSFYVRSGGDEIAYHNAFDDLDGVYLEDSWVLSVTTSSTVVTFTLDLVLTPAHDLYRAPLPGEAHCYRRADLRVESDSAIRVHLSGLAPAIDAAGEFDYGHIDTFHLKDDRDDAWVLTGDWGDAHVRHPRVTVTLHDDGEIR